LEDNSHSNVCVPGVEKNAQEIFRFLRQWRISLPSLNEDCLQVPWPKAKAQYMLSSADQALFCEERGHMDHCHPMAKAQM